MGLPIGFIASLGRLSGLGILKCHKLYPHCFEAMSTEAKYFSSLLQNPSTLT